MRYKRTSLKKRVKDVSETLGPGFITGAADDDPSGIATYSQTGAQFGFSQLWTALFMLPLMIAIQEACARIGAQKGKGLAHIIKYNYGKTVYFIVTLLLIANIINIGADLGAMTEATILIFPLNFTFTLLVFSVIILLAEIYIGYRKYANILKWLCLSLLAYPITIFVVNAPVDEILKATFIPHIEFNYQYLFLLTGLFGTTISPYMFFWQSSQEVEEDHKKKLISHNGKTRIKQSDMFKIRLDTVLGMLFSQITSWCIVVVAGTVLHAHHVADIKSAADVAKMLEPLVHYFPHAGLIAKIIFAIGIVGLGLLSVPVLAGSAAYAVCDAFNLPQGLNRKFSTAKWFYNVMIIAVFVGILINLFSIDPFKMLVYAAVLNGVIAVPLIFMIAIIARNKKIMGKYKSGWLSEVFVWLTFMGMFVSAVSMFFTFKTM